MVVGGNDGCDSDDGGSGREMYCYDGGWENIGMYNDDSCVCDEVYCT